MNVENHFPEGPANAHHAQIAERLVAAILAKHNASRPRMNAERVAAGLEPFKEYEIKRLEISHAESTALTFVTIEAGLVGDEGTLAGVFCRDRRHISIGRRGGVTLLNPKRGKRGPRGFKGKPGWFGSRAWAGGLNPASA